MSLINTCQIKTRVKFEEGSILAIVDRRSRKIKSTAKYLKCLILKIKLCKIIYFVICVNYFVILLHLIFVFGAAEVFLLVPHGNSS